MGALGGLLKLSSELRDGAVHAAGRWASPMQLAVLAFIGDRNRSNRAIRGQDRSHRGWFATSPSRSPLRRGWCLHRCMRTAQLCGSGLDRELQRSCAVRHSVIDGGRPHQSPFVDDPILSPQPQSTALMHSNHYWAVPLRTLAAAESFAVKTAPTGAGLLLPPSRSPLRRGWCLHRCMRTAQLCGSGLDRELPQRSCAVRHSVIDGGRPHQSPFVDDPMLSPQPSASIDSTDGQ